MRSFISKAREFYNKKKINLKIDFERSFDIPKIVAIGVGGAGNNIIHRLNLIGAEDIVTIACNTDKQHLLMTRAEKRVLIGRSITRGLGAGGHSEIGRRAAELGKHVLEDVLQDSDLVFICVGLGGGTGTGAGPIIADVAKKQGAIVIGFAVMPFSFERERTKKH